MDTSRKEENKEEKIEEERIEEIAFLEEKEDERGCPWTNYMVRFYYF